MKSHCGLLVMALVSVSAACSLRQSPATPEGVTVGVMQDGVTMRRLTFEGSDEFNRSQIAEALDGAGIEMRLDSWIGPETVRQTEDLLRQMFSDRGYLAVEITHEITPVRPDRPQFVHLKFNMNPGPLRAAQERPAGCVELPPQVASPPPDSPTLFASLGLCQVEPAGGRVGG